MADVCHILRLSSRAKLCQKGADFDLVLSEQEQLGLHICAAKSHSKMQQIV